MSGHTPWAELKHKIDQPWYRFGWWSFSVLYRRTMNRRPRPIFRARMMRQRAKRGWSDEDVWGFHFYLAQVIAGGIGYMRDIQHGHPGSLTPEAWSRVLLDIETGMEAALLYEKQGHWEDDGQAAFYFALTQLRTWWFDLWD